MPKSRELILVGTMMLALLPCSLKAQNQHKLNAPPPPPPAPVYEKTEDGFIKMLDDRDYKRVLDALDRLPHLYPQSTAAVAKIKQLLMSKDPVIANNVAPNIIVRKAARSLGNYHAALSPEELQVIYDLLHSRDVDTVLDALKSLRGLNAPDAVPQIVPLLNDKNHNVLRDSCRTLAVLGNKDTIPAIQPLVNSPMSDVRADARDAIAKLSAKP